MPLTDREQALLRLLNQYLVHLRSVQDLDPQTIEPFGTQDAAVQRWLQLAVQCCIDLGDSLLVGAQHTLSVDDTLRFVSRA